MDFRKKLKKHLNLKLRKQKNLKLNILTKNIMENKNIKSFDEHLEKRYGAVGTVNRIEFEIKAKSFAIGEMIKEQRLNAKLTQEQLAQKTGAKKSFISRIENGHSDIQLSTLYRLLEVGLGRTVTFSIK